MEQEREPREGAVAIRPASADEIDEMLSIDSDACTLYVEAGLDADLGPGHPYSVAERAYWTRRARGRRLLEHAIEWAGGEELWLTTYSHVPWNRPFYERHGFVTIPEPDCPAWIVALLNAQREALPAPDKRIAMRRGGGR